MTFLKHVYSEEISPVKYYNFDLTASCYAAPWEYDGKYAYIPLEFDSYFGVTRACMEESVVKLEVFLTSGNSDLIERALDRAIFILGLKENLDEFYSLCTNDPLLDVVKKEFLGIHMRAVPSVWEGLLIGICQQNASFKQGWRMLFNIRKKIGQALRIPHSNKIIYTFPSYSRILTKQSLLRECGVGYREEIIIDVAKFFLEECGDDLESIRGIGQYTARLAKILGERNYGEFPVDRWFASLLPRVYMNSKEKLSVRKIEEFAKKRWGKWSGLAAIMITIVTAARPLRKVLEDIEKGKLNPLPNEPAPLTLWRFSL